MCAYNYPAGYYTHVSTLADVQENVMEYLHVLSRPMVINHDHDIIWTEAYMDSVVSYFRLVSVILKSVSIVFGTFLNHHFMLALFPPFPPSVTKHTRGMLIVLSACVELLVL